MMVICRKRSDLDLVTTCKRGSELKTRPPTVSTETSSLLLYFGQRQAGAVQRLRKTT